MSVKMAASCAVENDHDYSTLEWQIRDRVQAIQGPLFTTDAVGLFEAYLNGIPENRQHYTCRCCRKFVETYGGLVQIHPSGATFSSIWDYIKAPPFFRDSIGMVRDAVLLSKVTGVFLSSAATWGVPKTGEWSHLSGVPSSVFKHPLLSASQMMAEKGQDFIMLRRGLAEMAIDTITQAVRVLEADAVDRSEKTLGVAKWVLGLKQMCESQKNSRLRDNLLWLAVATAPAGWCHIRSTMISTLLADIEAGMEFAAVSRRWASKMHPLQYQRPTAPPKDGNIAQANAVMEKLGATGALARRFAKLADLTTLWKPRPAEIDKPGGGVFDHLKAKPPAKALELPATKMTWTRFRVEVLPNALEMEFLVPSGNRSFYGMVTAANPDAPNLLQWDNPVSWYFYHGGSTAGRWNLVAGAWTKVNAICLKPSQWGAGKFPHQGEGAFFVLNGAKDTQYKTGALFFPETLKAEYHGIRSVLERYSQTAAITGVDEGDANGIAMTKGEEYDFHVRVKTPGGLATYRLDRWE